MMKIKLGEKERKIRFGLRTLCETEVLDDVTKFTNAKDEDFDFNTLAEIGKLIAELLLAGLQRDKDFKIDYEDEQQHKEALSNIYDLLDDWSDEEGNEIIGLFTDLQKELTEKGFLGNVMKSLSDKAVEMDATVVPQDHNQKQA